MGPFKGATDRASRNFLVFKLGENARIALRPSGTEPKAKAYIEASGPPAKPGMSAAAWMKQCDEVNATVDKLAEAFMALCK